ncbi:DNA glycosylase AlkZ-like family protein, partial [Streptomyces sp. NPDC059455]|uniref:DNA glycosylase AlkZ-like family protein n=1 Tax=Streptomyces sp. NPDC059455 TaxID=3346837 RepID=UPI0036C41B6A
STIPDWSVKENVTLPRVAGAPGARRGGGRRGTLGADPRAPRGGGAPIGVDVHPTGLPGGRELFDLPGAPRPDPDTPAPVRFLPAFDNAILGYHDRGRIIDDAHRGLSVAGERVVLVDGRVAATWRVDAATVVVTPLGRLSSADRTAVGEEGRELASFLSDGESHRVRVATSSG